MGCWGAVLGFVFAPPAARGVGAPRHPEARIDEGSGRFVQVGSASAVRSVRPGVFRGRQGMRSLIYPHRPFKKRKKAQYPLKQGMLRRKIA